MARGNKHVAHCALRLSNIFFIDNLESRSVGQYDGYAYHGRFISEIGNREARSRRPEYPRTSDSV